MRTIYHRERDNLARRYRRRMDDLTPLEQGEILIELSNSDPNRTCNLINAAEVQANEEMKRRYGESWDDKFLEPENAGKERP